MFHHGRIYTESTRGNNTRTDMKQWKEMVLVSVTTKPLLNPCKFDKFFGIKFQVKAVR